VTTASEERRSGRRVAITGGPEFQLNKRVRVKFVDISVDGALVSAESQLPSGMTGRIRVPLGSRPFESRMKVTRCEVQTGPVLLGTMFVETDRRNQQTLEDFLRPTAF
jgi:hypothetical protein